MIESDLAMDFSLLPAASCRASPQETVARSGRSFRSNTKPAGFARPEVVAVRSQGPS